MRKRLVATAMLAVMVLSGCEDGAMLLLTGKDRRAYTLMQDAKHDPAAEAKLAKLADKNDGFASYALAYLYEKGECASCTTGKKQKEALEYYLRSKLPEANYNAVNLLLRGVRPDESFTSVNPKATLDPRNLLEQAAGQARNSELKKRLFYRLALINQQGAAEFNIPPNMSRAIDWYINAGNLGDGDAQFIVGDALVRGKGRPKDLYAGMNWLKRSADNWNPQAMVLLGGIYTSSNELVKHKTQGVMHLLVALDLMPQYGARIQEMISFAGLDEKEMATAQKLARQWVKSNQKGLNDAQEKIDYTVPIEPRVQEKLKL